jgi:Predicted inhibitor of MCP methylation, homolog of CheC
MKQTIVDAFVDSTVGMVQDITGISFASGQAASESQLGPGENVMILIGITGNIRGNAVVNMTSAVALQIAGAMMMDPELPEIDEIAQSALCELCNMVVGNAVTTLSQSGISMDITPPTILMGQNMQYRVDKSEIICVPLLCNDANAMEINISYSAE